MIYKKETKATLVYIVNDGQVLLGYKKRGFGQNRWNGFGGKILPQETALEGALRELQEESGIIASKAEERGYITYRYEHTQEIIYAHVFFVLNYQGNPVESEEMRPQWFQLENVPYNEMWADDQYWLFDFLHGAKIKADFLFKDYNEIISHQVEKF